MIRSARPFAFMATAIAAWALAGCGQGADTASVDHSAHMRPDRQTDRSDEADLATDNIAYIAQLMVMRGHLQAGAALYEAGDQAMAATHMKHPQDELYADLVPAFEARGFEGFADALDALAAAVKSGASSAEVAAKLDAARAGIDEGVARVQAGPRETLLAMAEVLRTAADEFDEGVDNGIVVNAHEYQDAYGFMTTVVEYLGRYDAGGGKFDAAVAQARDIAATALEVAPGVIPPKRVTTSSVTITAAAARVEAIAQAL